MTGSIVARSGLPEVVDRFSWYTYRRKLAHDANFPLISEANRRLKRLLWILQRVERLEARHERQWQQVGSAADAKSKSLFQRRRTLLRGYGDELEVMTEAFYYFAFRVRTILRKRLPDFKGFEARGINEVRNDLIEHPRVLAFNFVFASPRTGPILKLYRSEAGVPFDRGLYLNAKELAVNLRRRLDRIPDAAPGPRMPRDRRLEGA
jgi:hypothetical protein